MFKTSKHIVFILAPILFFLSGNFSSKSELPGKPLTHNLEVASSASPVSSDENTLSIKPHNILILKVHQSTTSLSENYKLPVIKEFFELKLQSRQKPYRKFFNTLLNYRGPPVLF